jgi:putative membrane protein
VTPKEPLLTEAEALAVRSAVERAEARSGAEIVPVVVPASEGYELATWKGAAFGAFAGLLVAAITAALRGGWGAQPAELLLPPAVGALAGAIAGRWAPLRRWLIGRAGLETTVEGAAWEAFVRHEVFATRDRTGLLIYVSLAEHQVAILADSGIHPRIAQREWNELARSIARSMRDLAPGAALLAAVERSGEVLASRGPVRRDDDANELPDAPVQS